MTEGKSNFYGRKFRQKSTSGLTGTQQEEIKKNRDLLKKYIDDQKGDVPASIYSQLEEYNKKLHTNTKFNTSTVYEDGIAFDSNIERMFYKMLKAIGYEIDKGIELQKHFELQPAFKLHGVSLKSINIYVDFCVKGCVLVDTKGMATQEWLIKWKLLKHQQGENFHYFMPKNKEECTAAIERIKFIIRENER